MDNRIEEAVGRILDVIFSQPVLSILQAFALFGLMVFAVLVALDIHGART